MGSKISMKIFKKTPKIIQIQTHLIDPRLNTSSSMYFEVFGLGDDGLPYKWNWVDGTWFLFVNKKNTDNTLLVS